MFELSTLNPFSKKLLTFKLPFLLAWARAIGRVEVGFNLNIRGGVGE